MKDKQSFESGKPLIRQLTRDKKLKPALQMLWLHLWSLSDGAGQVQLSMCTLVKDLPLSKSTLLRSIRQLESLGYLIVYRKAQGNTYTLALPKWLVDFKSETSQPPESPSRSDPHADPKEPIQALERALAKISAEIEAHHDQPDQLYTLYRRESELDAHLRILKAERDRSPMQKPCTEDPRAKHAPISKTIQHMVRRFQPRKIEPTLYKKIERKLRQMGKFDNRKLIDEINYATCKGSLVYDRTGSVQSMEQSVFSALKLVQLGKWTTPYSYRPSAQQY